MEQLLLEVGQKLTEAKATGGWLAVAGVALMFIIRIYTSQPVQNIVPKAAKWDNLTPIAKVLIPFCLAFIGGLLLALGAKVSIGVAIASAIGAGVTAIAAHQTTKALGQTMDVGNLNKNPMYEPSTIRKAMSLAVPIDMQKARESIEKK